MWTIELGHSGTRFAITFEGRDDHGPYKEVIAMVHAPSNARLIAAAPELAQILDRILRAHESGNNGAVTGEAKLCVQFVELARAALKEAGVRS